MKKVQRIKLKLLDNPVKWDASITGVSRDGNTLSVSFDGPFDDMPLYRHSPNLLADWSVDQYDLLQDKTRVRFFQVV